MENDWVDYRHITGSLGVTINTFDNEPLDSKYMRLVRAVVDEWVEAKKEAASDD